MSRRAVPLGLQPSSAQSHQVPQKTQLGPPPERTGPTPTQCPSSERRALKTGFFWFAPHAIGGRERGFGGRIGRRLDRRFFGQ